MMHLAKNEDLTGGVLDFMKSSSISGSERQSKVKGKKKTSSWLVWHSGWGWELGEGFSTPSSSQSPIYWGLFQLSPAFSLCPALIFANSLFFSLAISHWQCYCVCSVQVFLHLLSQGGVERVFASFHFTEFKTEMTCFTSFSIFQIKTLLYFVVLCLLGSECWTQ